jgi:ubiquinone/menaquinone biosynthesis C-methylase UbiE
MNQPNAQYNVAKAGSLAVRVAAHARRKMYQRFLSETAIQPGETLLDVGATSDQSYEASNYIEAWYPHKDRITAVGLDDASFLEAQFPGITYRRADGRKLPFHSGTFDVVHSSAVLEHVGGFDEQREFVNELVRVARRVVFLTTPNRWYPIEFHSLLPFLHWLPKPWFRRLLRGTRYHFFSLEENLNLVDRSEIFRLCRDLDVRRVAVDSHRFLGWPSNLLVTIVKRRA